MRALGLDPELAAERRIARQHRRLPADVVLAQLLAEHCVDALAAPSASPSRSPYGGFTASKPRGAGAAGKIGELAALGVDVLREACARRVLERRAHGRGIAIVGAQHDAIEARRGTPLGGLGQAGAARRPRRGRASARNRSRCAASPARRRPRSEPPRSRGCPIRTSGRRNRARRRARRRASPSRSATAPLRRDSPSAALRPARRDSRVDAGCRRRGRWRAWPRRDRDAGSTCTSGASTSTDGRTPVRSRN